MAVIVTVACSLWCGVSPANVKMLALVCRGRNQQGHPLRTHRHSPKAHPKRQAPVNSQTPGSAFVPDPGTGHGSLWRIPTGGSRSATAPPVDLSLRPQFIAHIGSAGRAADLASQIL
ncbi:MAG: hypothetical protein WDO73_05995 [Ignavibacteriota bacterium]